MAAIYVISEECDAAYMNGQWENENPYALKLYDKNGYTKRGHADWRKGRFYLMEKSI